ncbi:MULTISPECIES: DUF72 domain-containing protein [Olivibacter]|uniref:DUF72 domain-containing protein n=2 Tax=Olivibacter TaxID=376469 RepID=A0ABV6HKS6_9SPHI|nr:MULTISPECIES: DUF72 domain-containing protein [Olivibacter]MDM8175541.1 DUF72 domain-containing protein [Olivibacter sp. 47]QEL02290.1 DUF72 domain-containing protein [Olivibacter sp. LS-1]
MAKRKGVAYIGTSGWHYKHWKGPFYPEGLKESEQLTYFVTKIPTVELNNSFYRLPSSETFSNWYRAVPAHFKFAVKGSRFITHLKKLKVQKEVVDEFIEHAGHLKDKLGPILFQLPPKWNINEQRLIDFLKLLPKDHRFTFEFRDGSWYEDRIYHILEKANCAFCIYELAGHQSPIIVTADFVYIRLHGPGAKYQGNYTDEQLRKWVDRCQEWQNEGRDVYVYFDNDQSGFAALNAQSMQKMLTE